MLTGTLCRLRPLSREDLPATLEWKNSVSLTDLVMGSPFPATEMTESAWYSDVLGNRSGNQLFLAIERLEDHSLCGVIFLHEIDWRSRTCQYGIKIGDSNRRHQGIGEEATRLLSDYAFSTLNLQKISLRVGCWNQAAIQLYRKLGFVEEGCLKREYFRQGSYDDVLLMAIFREE